MVLCTRIGRGGTGGGGGGRVGQSGHAQLQLLLLLMALLLGLRSQISRSWSLRSSSMVSSWAAILMMMMTVMLSDEKQRETRPIPTDRPQNTLCLGTSSHIFMRGQVGECGPERQARPDRDQHSAIAAAEKIRVKSYSSIQKCSERVSCVE